MAFIVVTAARVAAQPTLSQEQMERFLRTAEIVSEIPIGKGVTGSRRLTLTDGTLAHDAHFQSIDIRRQHARVGGRGELWFADSYHFNIAAYRIARLLDLDHMVPVSIERVWEGEPGALTWWIDAVWDEASRNRARVRPVDLSRWTRHLSHMNVFGQLVHDTDRNHGNVIYTADWDLWLIDFTRAFRPWSFLRDARSLEYCDRGLFERLQTLTLDQVRKAVGDHLTQIEAIALIERRDVIVAHLLALIADRGEHRVLL